LLLSGSVNQVIVVAALIGVTGCTSGQLSGDAGGTSGTTGGGGTDSGGTTEGGGRDGANDDAKRPADIPCCIATLMAACPTDGACTQSSSDGGAVSRACYASGVKVISSTDAPSGCATADDACYRSVTVVYKPDGSLCYRLEHVNFCAHACETLYDNWYNAAGELVAQSQSSSYVLSGNGYVPPFCVRTSDASTDVDSGNVCPNPPAGPACTAGTCP